MKHIVKVANISEVESISIRPLIAMDNEGNLFGEGASAGPTLEMVDLGLPSGILWAKTNIGAQSETDYGQYFQWAATTPLHIEGRLVNPAADQKLQPYPDRSKYDGEDYDTLQPEDDIAAVTYGVGYRMPTQDDFQELIDETNNEWTSINNVNGYKFTSKSDSSKYIFLPAAGFCYLSNYDNAGREGDYWSSSLNIDESFNACALDFDSGEASVNDYYVRYSGFSVRPVQD